MTLVSQIAVPCLVCKKVYVPHQCRVNAVIAINDTLEYTVECCSVRCLMKELQHKTQDVLNADRAEEIGG